MAWVKIVRAGEGDRVLDDLYERLHVPPGLSPGSPYDEMSLNPEAMAAFHELQRTLRYGPSDLTRLDREMIATYVSAVKSLARQTGLADRLMLGDMIGAHLDARERTMLDYARKLALHPYSVTPMDITDLRAVGFSDDGIVDIALHTALFAAFTRIADGLGGSLPAVLLEDAERLRLPQAWGAFGHQPKRGGRMPEHNGHDDEDDLGGPLATIS
jgi:uncharacterized peroxidase-related enzyme